MPTGVDCPVLFVVSVLTNVEASTMEALVRGKPLSVLLTHGIRGFECRFTSIVHDLRLT